MAAPTQASYADFYRPNRYLDCKLINRARHHAKRAAKRPPPQPFPQAISPCGARRPFVRLADGMPIYLGNLCGVIGKAAGEPLPHG
jgi:hypothetical protein